jgi:hypothetical protein
MSTPHIAGLLFSGNIGIGGNIKGDKDSQPDPIAVYLGAPVMKPVAAPKVNPVVVPVVKPVAAPKVNPVVVPAVKPVAAPKVNPVVVPAVKPVTAPKVNPVVAPVLRPAPTGS